MSLPPGFWQGASILSIGVVINAFVNGRYPAIASILMGVMAGGWIGMAVAKRRRRRR